MAVHFLNGQLRFDAEHGVDRPRHAEIGKVAGAVRQDLFVGGLHMCVRTKDGGHTAVKIIGQTFLFSRGFGVKIDECDFRQSGGENAVRRVKGIVERLHVHHAHQIDDADLDAAHVVYQPAAPGRAALGEVRGAQERFAGIKDGVHLPAPLLRLIYKVKGSDRVVLVTDSMRGAGMPEGKSILGPLDGGQEVIIEDGVAKLPDRSAFDYLFWKEQEARGRPVRIVGRF